MAGISMMQKLLDNALVSQFAKSLKHSDLPEGWADNPEIVQLAEDAYREMGTESPWFKAWFGNSKVVDEAGEPLEVYHGTNAYGLKKFKPGNSGYLGGGIYTTPSRSMAERYTDYDTVHELYEKMENPFVVRSTDASAEILGELFGSKAGKERSKRESKQGNASKIITKADAKKLQQKGYDGVFWDVPSGKEYSTLDPYSIKSTSNRGTFNPADPNIYKGLIPAVGAGGLLGLMGPEEAEAAVRPDYAKRILEKHEKGSKANIESGTLEPYLYDQVKEQSPHAVNEVLSSAHAIKQRMKNPGWSPAHTIQRVSEVMDSKKDGLVVKNWQEDTGAEDYAKHGILMPYKEEPTFTPYIVDKKGKIVFKTILPPTRGQLAKVNVGVEGGVPLISRELTDAEVKPSAQRLPVSVVTPTTGVIMPESLTRSNRKDGDFWPSMARQFGLGTRGVIEGLGTGATLGFGDPGRVIADFIGLPVPETDIERQRVGLNAGVTDGLTTFAGGVGAAKMAASPVVRGVGMELADKPLLGAGIGGLLGLLTYDEED